MSERPVRVKWTDAWFELDDSGERPECFDVTTYGFLLEDAVWVRVAGESTPSGHRAVSHIPRVLVKELVYLDEP